MTDVQFLAAAVATFSIGALLHFVLPKRWPEPWRGLVVLAVLIVGLLGSWLFAHS